MNAINGILDFIFKSLKMIPKSLKIRSDEFRVTV